MTSAGDRDTLAGIARQIVADYALGTDSVHKNWRCGYPDTYGPCDCVDEFANDFADGLLASDWLREHDRATYAHGYHHGYKDAAYDHDAAVYGDQDEYLIDRAERAAANEYRTTEDTDG